MSPRFHEDDLSGAAIRALVAAHLEGMHEASPPGAVHALDVGALRAPGVTFWSAWVGDELAGCGALKVLDAERGELKSMRVASAFLGRGVGRAMLEHLIAEARARAPLAVARDGLHPAVRGRAAAVRARRLHPVRRLRGLRRRRVQRLHDARDLSRADVTPPARVAKPARAIRADPATRFAPYTGCFPR